MIMQDLATSLISIFDRYYLLLPKKWHSHWDGQPGRRTVFITDDRERITISFEEEMELMDMLPGGEESVSYQCRQDGKYLHLRRKKQGAVRHAFFHLELAAADGSTLCLPGQMVVDPGYLWADGIEPGLMEILKGISVK